MSTDAGILVDDLWIGEMKSIALHGRRLLLVRLEEGVFAYEDRCAHLGVPLSEGTLAGGVLTCRAHHYQYDARTGAGINPKTARLVSVPLSVRDGRILLDEALHERSGS